MHPRAPRACWRPLLAACLGLALSLPAAAQSGSPIDVLRNAATALAEPQAQAATEALDAAAAADRESAALREQLQALEAEVAAAPARSREFERQLAEERRASLSAWQARLPAGASVEALEAALEEERRAVDALRERADLLTRDLATRLAQPGRSGASLAELQQRLQDLATPRTPPADEPAALSDARRLRREAERSQVQAELALRQAQQDAAPILQRLGELELRALRHRISLREPRLAELRDRIAERGRAQLEDLATRLDEAAAAAAALAGPVADIAGENARLGRELVDQNERLSGERDQLARQEAALARDQAGLRDARARLELGGQSAQVGTWLWSELRRLEPEPRLARELDATREALTELRLRLVDLDERQRGLDDLAAAVRERLRGAGADPEDEAAPAPGTDPGEVERLLEQQRELSDRLEPLAWRRIATLEQAERSLLARQQANRDLRDLLDRQLLWIRSHPPVDAAWLASVPAGLQDLVKPSRYATSARLLADSLLARPVALAGSLLLLGLLWALRRRAPARLERLAQVVKDVRRDRYRRTLESLAWTIVAALPLPVALALLGGWLGQAGEAGKFSDSLGNALVAVSLPALTLCFLGWLVRERGLAHAHFRWTRPRREAIARWIPRLVATLLPLYFLVALGFIRNQELAISVSARLAMLAAAGVAAWAMWRLLAPEAAWHSRGASREPSAWRRALRLGIVAMQLGCAALALEGHLYTAAILMDAQFASVGVVAAVAVLHGLLSRWFVLGERRLALKRLEQKREAEAESAAGEAPAGNDGGEAVPVELEEEITLEKVSEHTRRLVRAAKLALLVVGLAWTWSAVLPAFFRFDDVVLWSITEAAAADGAPTVVPITLMAVLMGLLVLALTFVAARNLPGLIEIGLLSRVHMDAASRYAITSVSRYAIVLVGTVVGLGLLGARWGQLQWMAAALTVGLGFGLQEIFANFVSGLILLFERPFRVGDVITVNNLDGTVTRIRTRATTILDFDNKEIVVPNKTFITGQLVNWTLSDETTRITFKVGVDYGTDPALVHRLLLQAAQENPRVLESPGPRSWLLEFGANSLDFELRVFVGAMNDRLAVRNEINMRLVELFSENQIGFAFPQLDLHVRDLPEAMLQAREARGAGGAGAVRDPREPGAAPGVPTPRG